MQNQTIYVMTGLIGSGKSTKARELVMADDSTVAVNRDHMRTMLNAGTYDFDAKTEPLNLELQNLSTNMALEWGFNVVLDACFLKKEHRREVIRSFGSSIKKVCVYCTENIHNIRNRMTNPRGFDELYWQAVYDRMAEVYEPPTAAEGFDEIITHKIDYAMS